MTTMQKLYTFRMDDIGIKYSSLMSINPPISNSVTFQQVREYIRKFHHKDLPLLLHFALVCFHCTMHRWFENWNVVAMRFWYYFYLIKKKAWSHSHHNNFNDMNAHSIIYFNIFPSYSSCEPFSTKLLSWKHSAAIILILLAVALFSLLSFLYTLNWGTCVFKVFSCENTSLSGPVKRSTLACSLNSIASLIFNRDIFWNEFI